MHKRLLVKKVIPLGGLGHDLVSQKSLFTTCSLKWLNELQYLALTATRGAVSGSLWKPLWKRQNSRCDVIFSEISLREMKNDMN